MQVQSPSPAQWVKGPVFPKLWLGLDLVAGLGTPYDTGWWEKKEEEKENITTLLYSGN